MVRARTVPLWIGSTFILLVGSSDLDASNWMKENISWLGNRKLNELCIPGTHNSGMNQISGKTAFAKACNILNQSRTIRKQLELGVRYFDVRPVISGGKFKTGHYSKIAGGIWQGGNGQPMDSIIKDINDFTWSHNELIIVSLSHSLNTDLGTKYYRPFNQNEWDRLFQMLDQTHYLFKTSTYTFLPSSTLGNITDNGRKAAVIYIVLENVYMSDRYGQGYYLWTNLDSYENYAETDSFSKMFKDQIDKMKKMSYRKYFILSWTLTLSSFGAVTCPVWGSIESLAKNANKKLNSISAQVSNEAFPNVILIDYVENDGVTKVALNVSRKVMLN